MLSEARPMELRAIARPTGLMAPPPVQRSRPRRRASFGKILVIDGVRTWTNREMRRAGASKKPDRAAPLCRVKGLQVLQGRPLTCIQPKAAA